jgi:glycosyltransferase involved in cell wall biosynthesis
VTLRILHCIYDDPGNPWVGGGGAVRVWEIYRRLAGRVDATVVTGNYPGARDSVREGVLYRHLGAGSPYAWSRLSYARAVNALIRNAEYDAAVFDFSTYTPVFVPRDRPTGITVHHVSGPTAAARWGPVLGRAISILERKMIRRAGWFSATSRATLEELREIAGPDVGIDLVYAGVPDELFDLRRGPADFVLYFGRLDVFQKGLDILLEAYGLLAREREVPDLVLAGRGKDEERVRSMAHSLGIGGRVRLLGAVSDEKRRALFAGAVLQVMPSRFEGFGMVAAEAMAAGVPLIAAAAGSLPEVVDAPAGGVLVAPGDSRALADALAGLLDNPAQRDALSRSARASAERFRWGAVAEDHLRFLYHVAGHAAPATQS